MGLGDLPGGRDESRATDISADGSIVIGWSQGASGDDTFRWTRANGMTGIGALTSGCCFGKISADGSTIVESVGGGIPSMTQGFRWTAAGGVELLPIPIARGVSGDGSVVVGQGANNAGFRWTESGGLEPLFGGRGNARAWDISADGSAIAILGGPTLGAIWTAAEGLVSLPVPPGSDGFAPYAISDDGANVVGFSGGSPETWRALRWTRQAGAMQLPLTAEGAVPGQARAVSADGSVIVGAMAYDTTLVNQDAFIWDAVHGTRSLSKLLTEEYGLGASLAGWRLAASAVSADGRTIAGAGWNPDNDIEAWVAFLGTPVPEPAEAALIALAACGACSMARRRMRHSGDITRASRWLALAVLLTVFDATPPACAQQAFFMGLGDLPGGDFGSRATDISSDGKVVVGWSVIEGNEMQGVTDAFRWTRETGMVALGAHTVGNEVEISSDGSTIVGNIGGGLPQFQQAFRWTEDGGLSYLTMEIVRGVSGDGSVLAGQGFHNGAWAAYRWTEAAGSELIIGGGGHHRGYDVSDDGSVFLDSGDTAAIWTEAGGLVTLPPLPSGKPFVGLTLSADGTVVVGTNEYSVEPSQRRVYRWTQESGYRELPPTPDGAVPFYFLNGNISADGSVIVGAAKGGVDPTPLGNNLFIWDTIHGTRNLKQVLINDYGLGQSIAGWTLPRGSWFGVSADGRTVYGDGLNPQGKQEGWVAYLGTRVPEPAGAALIAMAAACGACCVRRRRMRCTGAVVRASRWLALAVPLTVFDATPPPPAPNRRFSWAWATCRGAIL